MSKSKANTREGTIRRCGHVWSSNETYYENDWHTDIGERFHATTWKFGSIHQSKVFIDYDHLMEGQHTDSIKCDGSVGVCLRPGKTMEEAMHICLDYIEEFKKNGPPSLEQVFKDSWEHWPTLYPNGLRIPVIAHLFFTIGGGYNWVDGAIMCTSPHDYLESIRRDEQDKQWKEARKASKELRELLKKYKLDKGEELEFDDLDFDERDRIRWSQDVFDFYPASEKYSNICLVPDDVKPEWLELAYEAAVLLRDRSGVPNLPKSRFDTSSKEDDIKRQKANRVLGAKLVAELERRFPHVAKKGQ